MKMKGVLDRIEDNKFAVILVDELRKEFVIPKDQLPDGTKPNAWLDLTITDDNITSVRLNKEATSVEEEKVENMMNKLRSKSRGSKFKR
jgi:hypothetical protein